MRPPRLSFRTPTFHPTQSAHRGTAARRLVEYDEAVPFPFGGEILPVGSEAPDFQLPDETGNVVRLSDFRGRRPVVLVFYPMDETPHCRTQLCQLRDTWASFEGKGVAVFGVNPGKAESHRKFRSRHGFPFPLLVDEEKKVAGIYGAGGIFIKRCVYGIGADGAIVFAEAGMPAPKKILEALEN